MGGSFGGYLSLATANLLSPRLLIAHAPPTDLSAVALGRRLVAVDRDTATCSADPELYSRESVRPADVPHGCRVLLVARPDATTRYPRTDAVTHRSLLALGALPKLTLYPRTGHAPLRRGCCANGSAPH